MNYCNFCNEKKRTFNFNSDRRYKFVCLDCVDKVPAEKFKGYKKITLTHKRLFYSQKQFERFWRKITDSERAFVSEAIQLIKEYKRAILTGKV